MANTSKRNRGREPPAGSAMPSGAEARAVKQGKCATVGVGDSDQRHLLYLAAQCLTQIRASRRTEPNVRPREDSYLATRREPTHKAIDRITTEYAKHWLADQTARNDKLFPRMSWAWGGLVWSGGRRDGQPVVDWLILHLESEGDVFVRHRIVGALGTVAGHVPAEQAARITDVFLERLAAEPGEFKAITAVLHMLAGHVIADHGARIAEALLQHLMEKPHMWVRHGIAHDSPMGEVRQKIAKTLAEVLGHVRPGQAARIVDVLLECLDAEQSEHMRWAITEALGVVAGYVSTDQAARIGGLLHQRLVSEPEPWVRPGIVRALGAVAGHIPAEQAARIAEVLLERLVSEPETWTRELIPAALVRMAGRVAPDQAARIAQVLLERLNVEPAPEVCWRLTRAVGRAARYFPAKQAARNVSVLFDRLVSERDDLLRSEIGRLLAAVSEHVGADQAVRIAGFLLDRFPCGGRAALATATGHVPAHEARGIAEALLERLMAEPDEITCGCIARALGEMAGHVPAGLARRIAGVLVEQFVSQPNRPSCEDVVMALGSVAGYVSANVTGRILETLLSANAKMRLVETQHEQLEIDPQALIGVAITRTLGVLAGRVHAEQTVRIGKAVLGEPSLLQRLLLLESEAPPHALSGVGVRWRQKLGRSTWVSHVRLLARGMPPQTIG